MTGGDRTPGPGDWMEYFEPGETLLLQGAPARGPRVTPLMVLLSLLGLPFAVAGGMAFLESLGGLAAGDAATGYSLFMLLFGLPFIAAGLALAFGPWHAAAKAHEKIRYALSARRAHVASSWWKRTLESYPIGPDDPVEFQQGRTDTVWFSSVVSRDSEGGPVRERTGFQGITDGRQVYDLLRRTQKDDA